MAGISDSITISFPGRIKKSKEEWLSLLPPCDKCGKNLFVRRWFDGFKPFVVCVNKECGNYGVILNEYEWKELGG